MLPPLIVFKTPTALRCKMTNQDPLQSLSEIHSMVTQLLAKVSILETNVAILNDKANGQLFPEVRFKAGKQSAPAQMQVPSNASQEVINDITGPQGIGVPLKQAKPKSEKARVFGAVYGQNKKPLHNVSVLITNQAKELVGGDLKTNLAGEWETQLGPGKYAITLTRAGMSAIYRFVEIKPGQQEARVM